MGKYIFQIGEETHPIREKITEVVKHSSSIFKNQYLMAQKAVESIVINNNDFNVSQQYYRNNIISFIGDRGSGKTSCIESFATYLKENRFKGKKYYILDIIDPSFFEKNHNILDLFIARLFERFSIELLKEENSLKVIEQFRQVKESLESFHSSSFKCDALEDLNKLAQAENLKKQINELILQFITFVKSDCLVITLDDIDLNINKAYEMAEQIRKYLILPNVIILMAVKLEQLDNVIKQQMLIENKTLLDNGILTVADISDMAEKYLDKLIPNQSRIYLPETTLLFNKNIEFIEANGRRIPEYNGEKLNDFILKLIYKKTRYLFYNPEDETSLVVPRNLREFRLLVKLLHDMDDFKKNNDGIPDDSSKYNQELFKRYFFETWIDSLGTEYRLTAKLLLEEDEPKSFNKKVVQLLNNVFLHSTHSLSYHNPSSRFGKNRVSNLDLILDLDNNVSNVSLGDAFAVLNYYKNRLVEVESQRLIFFIKSLYSIKLYDYYLELVSMNVHSNKKSRYIDLIGGNFFETTNLDLLPKNQKSGESRNSREIDGLKLFSLIKRIVYSDCPRTKYQVIALQIAEFFMLCIGRNEIETYRVDSDIYYTKMFAKNTKKLHFDIMSLFFNIINIERTYTRFDEKIFDIAKRNENSLYNNIIIKNKEKSLSLLCLRNAEIISMILTYLINKKERISDKSDLRQLSSFFKSLTSFRQEFYDEENSVSFEFLFPIFELLNSLYEIESSLQNGLSDEMEISLPKDELDKVKIIKEFESIYYVLDSPLNSLLAELFPSDKKLTFSFIRTLLREKGVIGGLSDRKARILEECVKSAKGNPEKIGLTKFTKDEFRDVLLETQRAVRMKLGSDFFKEYYNG